MEYREIIIVVKSDSQIIDRELMNDISNSFYRSTGYEIDIIDINKI